MNSLTLSFNDVNFHPVTQNDGQIWLSSSELAKVLGYKSAKSVSNLYNSNKDEFSDSMTTVTESMTVRKTGTVKMPLRIFSLRGCHLIAMFARTDVAKAFRKWVLDVLDKEVGISVCKTTKDERTALHEAHALLVTKTKHLNVSDAWKLIHQRFNVDDIKDIPYDSIPVAVEYVHHLIALYSNADRKQYSDADQQNVHALASHMIWVMEWWRTFGNAISTISPTMASSVHHHFVDGSCIAWRYIDKTKQDDLHEAAKDYPWLLSYREQQYIKS